MVDQTLNTSTEYSRKEPLNVKPTSQKTLNETINTEFIDIPLEDNSAFAKLTRCITGIVGSFFSPRQILIVLRILKALTFSFLVLSLVADLMYIFFVQLRTSEEVSTKVGGHRDTIIRSYGLVLTVFAFMVELDVKAVKYFVFLKFFIPRACHLFLIATISSSPPLHQSYNGRRSSNNDNAEYGDDDAARGYSDQQVSQEIPSSTIIFQMVTSLVIACCALCYFILGLFCVDRLRSKAFLSLRDPVESTAIPSNANQQHPDDEESMSGSPA